MHNGHIVRRLQKPLVGAGVQPGHAAPQQLHAQRAALQIDVVDGRNLQLPPGGGGDALRDGDHIVVIEVEAGDGVIGFWALRLLLNGENASLLVELYHSKGLGIGHVIAENRSPALHSGGSLQNAAEMASVKNVVPQNQAHMVPADEGLTDQKGLGQAVGMLLHSVGQLQTVGGPIPQQVLKNRQVPRRGDNQDLTDACQHQSGQRIIDHGFIVDWENLLGNYPGNRIEPRSGASGENNSFHCLTSVQPN